ncbi:MAG: hypothetical protein A2174_02190 [Candidatus Portnoybacteria bacterium RBG_13_41_18]|uniref:Uncharacterized protein n=1 Tax=Candidatus Portnoybacteria bacterium RBG_13_41_18 TaxID=1801991 RepID=A0A1G2FAR4_9BACT|nr:MAG: hypothetical protein A2174_02190 [Candidatus Portnoybacteria bacterium RBG_13_41_18]
MGKKWEETKEILTAIAAIGGGTLLADDFLNPQLIKAVVGLILILIAFLFILPAKNRMRPGL